MTSFFESIGILVLILLFPFSLVIAQHDNANNSLKEGERALQFQVTDNFNISSFTGTTLSYKIQRSQDKAFRLGLGLNTSFENGAEPSTSGEQDITTYGANVDASFTWMNYVNPNADLKFYYGLGPAVNFGYSQDEIKTDQISEEVTETTLGLSALGYTGVEWFFQKSMSIHAEYRASFDYRWTNEDIILEGTSGADTTSEINNTNYSFGGNGVHLGVSLYF